MLVKRLTALTRFRRPVTIYDAFLPKQFFGIFNPNYKKAANPVQEKPLIKEENFNNTMTEISTSLKVYENLLKQKEIQTLERVLSLPTANIMGSHEYSKLLQDLMVIDLDHVQVDHLERVIKFVGGSIFRKVYMGRAYQVVKKYLKKLKQTEVMQKILTDPVGVHLSSKNFEKVSEIDNDARIIFPKMHDIILSCSNLNYYDEELFRGYQKFIEHNNGQYIKEALEPKNLIALLWSYKRLNKDTANLCNVLVKSLEASQLKLSDVNALRLLWILSIDAKSFSTDFMNRMIDIFLDKKAERTTFSYNNKNMFQIMQICYNLYPSLLPKITYHKETDQIETVSLPYEKVVEQLKEAKNPYMKKFEEVYKLFKKCEILTSYRIEDIQINNKSQQVVYVESNNKTEPSYYVMKPKIVPTGSMFEENVFVCLKEMNVQFLPKIKLGMYEVDVLIHPNIIFEINGDNHYVYESDREFLCNYKLKLR